MRWPDHMAERFRTWRRMGGRRGECDVRDRFMPGLIGGPGGADVAKHPRLRGHRQPWQT